MSIPTSIDARRYRRGISQPFPLCKIRVNDRLARSVQIDMYGFADRIFEGREIPLRRPLFEFGIAMRIGGDEQGLAAVFDQTSWMIW